MTDENNGERRRNEIESAERRMHIEDTVVRIEKSLDGFITRIEKRFDNLPCKEHGDEIIRMGEKIIGIRSFINRIGAVITAIITAILVTIFVKHGGK